MIATLLRAGRHDLLLVADIGAIGHGGMTTTGVGMDALALLLWAGAVGGILAVVVAVVRPRKRRWSLLVAALLFLPIGVLGILSVGVFFLLAAALCVVGAILGRSEPDPTDAAGG